MLAQFSVAPFDKGESLSTYVAPVLDLIDKSGLDYRLGAMGTTVEGDTEEVFELIKKCHLQTRKVSKRVITHIEIDDREGAVNRLEGKPKSVEAKLGRKLKR